MTPDGNPDPSKRNIAIIVGITIGALSLLITSILVIVIIRRRRRSRFFEDRKHWPISQVDRQKKPRPVDPFTLKYASVFASKSRVKQASPSDKKRPIPAEASVPLEASKSTAGDFRRPSGTSSLAPSETTATVQLQEQEEARIGSSEWVSRAEYDAVVGEMARQRAEMSWFRDAQQSDWVLGPSDEIPPPYSRSKMNSR
jgi:hypothetical protein